MPWAWHSLPSLMWAGLKLDIFLGWSYNFFGFQIISIFDTTDSSLDLFLSGNLCLGTMDRVYWFKGHSFSQTKSAKFTVMWKKQLLVMAYCPSCLWDAWLKCFYPFWSFCFTFHFGKHQHLITVIFKNSSQIFSWCQSGQLSWFWEKFAKLHKLMV